MTDSKEGFAAVIERLMSLDDGQDRRRWLRYAGIIPASSADYKNISNDVFLFMNEVNKYNQSQPNKDKQINDPMWTMQRHMPILTTLYDIHHKTKGTAFSANTEKYWPKDVTVSFNKEDAPLDVQDRTRHAEGFYAPLWNENKVVVNRTGDEAATLAHELQHIKYKRNAYEKVTTPTWFGLASRQQQRWERDYAENRVVNQKRQRGKDFAPNAMNSLDEWLANVREKQALSPEGSPPVYPGLTDAEALHLQNYYK